MTSRRETIALVIDPDAWADHRQGLGPPWDGLVERQKANALELADAILAALPEEGGDQMSDDIGQLPDGWVAVPVKPTEAMLEAAARALKGMTFNAWPAQQDAAIYRAMIEARPLSAGGGDE